MECVFAAKRKQRLPKLRWLPPYSGFIHLFSLKCPGSFSHRRSPIFTLWTGAPGRRKIEFVLCQPRGAPEFAPIAVYNVEKNQIRRGAPSLSWVFNTEQHKEVPNANPTRWPWQPFNSWELVNITGFPTSVNMPWVKCSSICQLAEQVEGPSILGWKDASPGHQGPALTQLLATHPRLKSFLKAFQTILRLSSNSRKSFTFSNLKYIFLLNLLFPLVGEELFLGNWKWWPLSMVGEFLCLKSFRKSLLFLFF